MEKDGPPARRERTSATLPVALMIDPDLIAADLVVGLAMVAAIPPGLWQVSASDPLFRRICRFKPRAIQESLVRLADAGWIAFSPGPCVPQGGLRIRIITPLWQQPDDDGEGGVA